MLAAPLTAIQINKDLMPTHPQSLQKPVKRHDSSNYYSYQCFFTLGVLHEVKDKRTDFGGRRGDHWSGMPFGG